jgi:hypothetical protein
MSWLWRTVVIVYGLQLSFGVIWTFLPLLAFANKFIDFERIVAVFPLKLIKIFSSAASARVIPE